MSRGGPALYHINLIREIRDREKKAEQKRSLTVTIGLGCFGFFLIALIYSGLTIWQMEGVIAGEKIKVTRLKQEYKKYTAASLIVDKTDIELLNDLKSRGIFWTKKLAAMAKHLPENYSITAFSFEKETLHVTGFGYASLQQDQLLILDAYLNRLRADSNFVDTFKKMQLNSALRVEDGTSRINFDFEATTSKWKGP